jgi:hypothetical protein
MYAKLEKKSSMSPDETYTVVNDRIRRNTTIYMVQYYDRLSPYHIQENTMIHGEKKTLVYCLRTRTSYTIVILNHAIRQNTLVYGEI